MLTDRERSCTARSYSQHKRLVGGMQVSENFSVSIHLGLDVS